MSRPHRPLSDWAKHRCVLCGESFGGPNPWKAAERFFTHPRHRACIERWYPIVDPPAVYNGKVGVKR